MAPAAVNAFAACLAACVAAGPAGQELGSAAEKAAQQRRDAGAPVRTLTDKDLPGQEAAVTPVNFQAYASARAELGALRRARPALSARLFDASRTVTRLAELEPALAAEPSVVDILARYGFTPREYLRIEQAVVTAMYWADQDLPDAFEKRLVHRANVRFVRENARLVRQLAEAYRRAEGREPWFDMSRFVERF